MFLELFIYIPKQIVLKICTISKCTFKKFDTINDIKLYSKCLIEIKYMVLINNKYFGDT